MAGWWWVMIVWLGCALQPLQAQTLRWAARGDALSMDPHAALEAVTLNLNALVYDGLVELDRNGRFVPALATDWQLVDPRRWRFNLRRGVRFQDGTPLTASDVVFSIERAQRPDSKFAVFAVPLGQPVAIDEHTLELRQVQPNPALLSQLSLILVMSRDWALAHQAAAVPDLKQNQEAWTNRHAMGSGRFVLQSREPGVRTVLARNPAWWGRFEGNVQQLVYLPIASDGTRTAALLAGDIDFMQDVPPQDVDRLAAQPTVRVLTGADNRLIYLGFDQSRDELAYASVKGRNPFKDERVREAFALAIDVDALKRSIMRGRSEPTACIAVSLATCLARTTETHPPADLPRARKLLAEAGYSDGFALTLDCPNDRYVSDQSLCVAIGGMLARIGIVLTIDARSKTLYFPKIMRNDTSFYLHGFGYAAPEAQFLLDPLLHSPDAATHKGDNNYGRLADAELDRLIDAAGTEMDPARRAGLIRDAQQLALDRHYLLPLHRQKLIWAVRANVHPVMTPDNIVRADWIRVE